MKNPSNRILENIISPNQKPALKYGIRPENLRIYKDREIRVGLNCNRDTFSNTVMKLGESWCANISSGATIHRLISKDSVPKILWHKYETLEKNKPHPEFIYDWERWRKAWAVQKSDQSGKKSFCLEIAGEEGLAHQIRLTKKSNIAPFLELASSDQAGEKGTTQKDKNGWGLLSMVEHRRLGLQNRPDISRRVEREALPAFWDMLTQCQNSQKISLVNSVCKTTCKAKFHSIIWNDGKVTLKSPDVIFHLDNSSIEEAWMVQCSCGCGEEVLDTYDIHHRLIASIACMGITKDMARLLPTLN